MADAALTGRRSLKNALRDFLGHLPDPPPICLDNQVGNLTVEGVPYGHQLSKDLFLVPVFEQRTSSASLCSFELLLNSGVQIDDKAPGAEMAAAVCVEHSASPGGQHNSLPLRQLVDNLDLTLPKPCFAFFLEDKGNVNAGAALDFFVTVKEVKVQKTRELAADG